MSDVQELVVATGNPGKLREIREILDDLPVVWRTLAEFPQLEMPEEGDDYASNALAKARTAAQATGCLALGDDSGLEVAGLSGRPGPRSARYGGPGLDAAGRVAHLLEEMRGLSGAARSARFVCVVAWAAPDGASDTAIGECRGRILEAPLGEGGFGYDPVFFSEELDAGMAQLLPEQKNRISHRARAFAALRASLSRRLAPDSR